MYDAVTDDCCYPGTTVLKNKLDLRSAEELADFEAEVSDARADEALPTGSLIFTFQSYSSTSIPRRLRMGWGNPQRPHFQRRQHVLLS
jgi:hypothetical protein